MKSINNKIKGKQKKNDKTQKTKNNKNKKTQKTNKIKMNLNNTKTILLGKMKKHKVASAFICLLLIAIVLSPLFIKDSYADGYSAACTSPTWYPKDSSVQRYIFNRIYYSISCADTYCTVYCQGQGGIYKDNLTATITGTLTMGGVGTNSGSHSYKYSKNGTNYTGNYYALNALSTNVTRTTANQAVGCSNYVYKSSGSDNHGQGQGCTSYATITVPALTYYTVSYDCNGGSNCPGGGGHYFGSNYTIPGDEPTREYYTFEGYTYNNTTYNAGQNCTINANIVLKANWTGYPYSIKFHSNGGTGTMNDLAMNYGTAKKLTANAFERNGYVFTGWNTEADGSGTSYDNGESVNNLTTTSGDEITLYAQWEQLTPYTVTADAKGGTIPETEGWTINGDIATKTIYDGQKYGEMPKPEKTGYTFQGWGLVDGVTYKQLSYVRDSDSTPSEYIDSGYKPKSTTGVAVRYYTQSEPTAQGRIFGVQGVDSDTASVSYELYVGDANEIKYSFKDGAANWIDTTLAACDASNDYLPCYSMYNTFKLNVKPGYWSMNNGIDTAISGNITRTANYNMAIMALNNRGTISNYTNAGISYFDIYESGEIVRSYIPCQRVSDDAKGLCDVLNNNTFYGNSGSGTLSGSTGGYTGNNSLVHIPHNHTLYANYSVNPLIFDNKTIDVGYSTTAETVNVEEATNGSGNTTYTKESGEEDIIVSSAGEITIPAEKDAGTYTISIKATDDVTGAEKTATYTIVVKYVYNVKFNANGGSGTMENQRFMFDEEKKLSENAFTKTNYNFLGWNTSSDASGTWYMAENKVKNLSSTNLATVNLYAQWTESSDVTINKDEGELEKDDYNNYIMRNKLAVPYTVHYNPNGAFAPFGYDERTYTGPALFDSQWKEDENGVWNSNTVHNSYFSSSSSIYSREFTLTSADTLTFEWAVSCETYQTVNSSTYGDYLYYTITKDGTILSGTGTDTKITGNANITNEADLTYTTVTKALEPGTYKITFTYRGIDHLTDAPTGLSKGFVKNIDLTNNSFYMNDQSFSADEKKALSPNKYIRPGYTFLGWSEDKDATEPTYTDQEVVTLLSEESNSTVNLYAIWKRDEAYLVSVNITGGTIVGDASKMVNTGEEAVFTLSPNENYGYWTVGTPQTTVGKVTCTNNHTGVISKNNTTITINLVKNKGISSENTGIQMETTCTITLMQNDNFTYTTDTTAGTIGYSSWSTSSYCCGTQTFNTHTGNFTVEGTWCANNNYGVCNFCQNKWVLNTGYVSGTTGTACSYNGTSVYYATTCAGTTSTSDSSRCWTSLNYNQKLTSNKQVAS